MVDLYKYNIDDDLNINTNTNIKYVNIINMYKNKYLFKNYGGALNIGDDLIIINMMNNYFYYINKSNKQTENTLNKILISTKVDTSSHSDKPDYYYRVSLIKTYDIIIKDYIDSFDSIKFIININYIKTNILNLLRTVVYVIILDNYKVKASNTQTIDYKINNNYMQIIDSLQILELNYLLELVKNFYEFALLKLRPIRN
jgi:hypothetical protein